MKPSPKAVRTFLFATLFPLILAWTAGLPSASAQTIQVTSANPSSTPQGTVNLNVTVNGKGFKNGALARFYVTGTTDPGGITVNSTAFVNSGQLVANINAAQNATISKFDILVTNTNGGTGKGTELFAVTAPDPAIGFTSATFSSLWVMNADGTNQTAILIPPNPTGAQQASTVRRPNWSPEGSQLVFESDIQGAGIYVINKDGSGLRKVTATYNYTGLADPVWSPVRAPDGQWKIAYDDQPPGESTNDIFLVNLDGTGLVNLTNTSTRDEFWPTWDPSATRLAVQVYPCSGCNAHLYEFDLGLVNGAIGITRQTDLTNAGPLAGANIYEPEWARTQDKIVLNSGGNLWVVSLANPANPQNITGALGVGGVWPSWSPDDSKIVYRRMVIKQVTISVIDASGTAVSDLANGDQPEWRRCCPTCVVPCAP